MRYGAALLILALLGAAIVTGAILLNRDGRAPSAPVSTLVSGRTLVDGTPTSAEISVLQSTLPLAELVGQQTFPSLAEGTSEADGRFTISSDVVEDPSAGRLILYANCYGVLTSCSGRGCAWSVLPPLRRVDGRWSLTSSGRPKSITIRIDSDEPGLCY